MAVKLFVRSYGANAPSSFLALGVHLVTGKKRDKRRVFRFSPLPFTPSGTYKLVGVTAPNETYGLAALTKRKPQHRAHVVAAENGLVRVS